MRRRNIKKSRGLQTEIRIPHHRLKNIVQNILKRKIFCKTIIFCDDEISWLAEN